jgi:hypothetical protein
MKKLVSYVSISPALSKCEYLVVEVTGFSICIQIKNHGYLEPNTSSRTPMRIVNMIFTVFPGYSTVI